MRAQRHRRAATGSGQLAGCVMAHML